MRHPGAAPAPVDKAEIASDVDPELVDDVLSAPIYDRLPLRMAPLMESHGGKLIDQVRKGRRTDRRRNANLQARRAFRLA